MIIGAASRFAVEFVIERKAIPWIVGKLVYRVAGTRVGNYDAGAELNVAAGAFADLLSYRGLRCDDRLVRAPASEIFRVIDVALHPATTCLTVGSATWWKTRASDALSGKTVA